MYKTILIIHLLAATIWTGGHLYLALGILPKILITKNIEKLLDFERSYEKIGMPALLVQVITGVYMSLNLLDFNQWFDFDNHISKHISIKIILLAITVILALIANFKIIPQLHKKNYLTIMAFFIYTVTIISVLFVITGASFRLYIY
ncbi:MAG: CopD family protein [Vicingaceae bacterium]